MLTQVVTIPPLLQISFKLTQPFYGNIVTQKISLHKVRKWICVCSVYPWYHTETQLQFLDSVCLNRTVQLWFKYGFVIIVIVFFFSNNSINKYATISEIYSTSLRLEPLRAAHGNL